MREKGAAMLERRPLVKSAVDTWANTSRDYIRKTFGETALRLPAFCIRGDRVHFSSLSVSKGVNSHAVERGTGLAFSFFGMEIAIYALRRLIGVPRRRNVRVFLAL